MRRAALSTLLAGSVLLVSACGTSNTTPYDIHKPAADRPIEGMPSYSQRATNHGYTVTAPDGYDAYCPQAAEDDSSDHCEFDPNGTYDYLGASMGELGAGWYRIG